MSEKALQTAEQRRKLKGKEAKERFTHLNAEFRRLARRDKKGFLSEQCKESEENNRMGKTRDFFRKVRDAKGLFHAKWTQKRTNDMALTEADNIKKWQEYTEAAAAKSLQSCPTLCDPTGSPVPGILQARTLEWVAIPFSRASSRSKD